VGNQYARGVRITGVKFYTGDLFFPVDYTQINNAVIDEKSTANMCFSPLPVNLIGPETVFISITGVHANHLSISNCGTKIGMKRKSIEPLPGGYEIERQRKDDTHKWLSVPVNAAYGEVISRTFDDTWANSIQFFNRVPIDQEWIIKLYDHQMNLMHLAPNQNVTLCFKKYDSVL
jgi:hypothetical protein